MIYAMILFAATYILMLTFSQYRPYIALASGAIFIVAGMLPMDQILGAIDFNVLMMIAGTMGLVQLFIDSKMPALLADVIMEKVPSVQLAAVALALFAGIISAFVDNVATVLMVAPIALEICKKLKTNPVPFIIGIAVSSNLQGAATLVGDTTAIMLGSYAGMSFLDFFVYQGKPGIFFAVELGAVLILGNGTVKNCRQAYKRDVIREMEKMLLSIQTNGTEHFLLYLNQNPFTMNLTDKEDIHCRMVSLFVCMSILGKSPDAAVLTAQSTAYGVHFYPK